MLRVGFGVKDLDFKEMVQDPHFNGPDNYVYLHFDGLPNLQTTHETKIYKRFS